MTAQWIDHYLLKFWTSAAIKDGREFLRLAHKMRTPSPKGAPTAEGVRRFDELRARHDDMELAKFHFLLLAGKAIRELKRLTPLFPTTEPLFAAAEHLLTEGKDIRDMNEHSDQYQTGRGKKQSEFFRECRGIAEDLPGDQRGVADATSLNINNNGHWIVVRLEGERVITELATTLCVTEPIPAPRSDSA